MQYLLREQRPLILYANFLGAFGRGKYFDEIFFQSVFDLAPFYIAADEEKKSIIVSIRGTLSATDILTDINIAEDVLESDLFGNGYCHSGRNNILHERMRRY